MKWKFLSFSFLTSNSNLLDSFLFILSNNLIYQKKKKCLLEMFQFNNIVHNKSSVRLSSNVSLAMVGVSMDLRTLVVVAVANTVVDRRHSAPNIAAAIAVVDSSIAVVVAVADSRTAVAVGDSRMAVAVADSRIVVAVEDRRTAAAAAAEESSYY